MQAQPDLHGVDGAGRGEQHAVADGLHHPAVVAGDDLGGDALEVLHHHAQLAPAHAAAARGVPDEVGESDGELPTVPGTGCRQQSVRVRREMAAPHVVLHVLEPRQQGAGGLHGVVRRRRPAFAVPGAAGQDVGEHVGLPVREP
ncbi:MAG: hypothetical protein M3P89_15455 [Actinomycetota bacterium]|nr:hypothetical protein [Actinomycetota bacterium]